MRSLELTLSRRRLFAGAAGLSLAAVAGGGLWSRVRAAPRITITEGNVQPMPIALPDFVGGALPDPAMARGVTQIITSNLQRSGLFRPLDPASFVEKDLTTGTVRVALRSWSRPGIWLSWIGYPLTRRIQRKASHAALGHLQRDAAQGANHKPAVNQSRSTFMPRLPASIQQFVDQQKTLSVSETWKAITSS